MKINRFVFSDGSVINYTPTEAKIMKAIMVSMDWDTIDKDLDIRKYYDDGNFSEGSLKKIFGKLLGESILDTKSSFKNIVSSSSKVITATLSCLTAIYNDIGYESLEYMYALSLNDMVEIVEDKRLINSIHSLAKSPTQSNVMKVYEQLDTVMHDPKYHDNKIAMAYTTGIVNKMQMKQCYGTRGFVINLDGTINSKPVVAPYLLGLYDNYEYTLDSKSASIALYYSQTAIQRSETFANGLQTAGMVVENAVHTDCGTQDSMEYTIEGPGKNIYGEEYGGDLKSLVGINYKLNANDKKWLIFDGSEKHLYGKTVYIRLAFHCKLKNVHSVCVECLGRLSLHAAKGFNIGMYLLSRLSDLLNQLVLSAKHLISSAISDAIILTVEAEKWLLIDDRYLKLVPNKIGKNLTMKVSLREFYGYKDLEGKDIHSINTHKLSKIKTLELGTEKDGFELVELTSYGKTGIFTKDFITYIQNNTIKVDDKYVLHINMKRWRKSWKLIEIPESMFDVRSYGQSIRSFMTDGGGKGIHKMTREEFVIELQHLTSRRFNISFTTIGLISYILGVRDPKNGDYRIARGTDYQMIPMNRLLTKGSITGAYTTGKLTPLSNMDTWSPDKRMDHPLDLYLAPVEVVEAEREGYYTRN